MNNIKLLLAITSELPPRSLLTDINLTEDQIAEWNNVKRFWSLISHALELYFSGQSIHEGIRLLREERILHEPAPEWVFLIIQRQLRLYEILNFTWDEILKEALLKDFNIPVRAPGEALKYILREQSITSFNYCMMGYTELPSRKTYNDINYLEKLQNKKVKGLHLSNIEKNKEANIIRNVKRNMPNHGKCLGADFLDFCLQVAANKPVESASGEAYLSYRRIEANINNILKREISPKGESSRTEVWVKGVRKYLT